MLTKLLSALCFAIVLAVVPPCQAADDLRTWQPVQGVSLEGTLLRVDGNRVTVRTADGKVLFFQFDTLSQTDQVYVRGWHSPMLSGSFSTGSSLSGNSSRSSLLGGSQPNNRTPDPKVVPGAAITILFPELGLDANDKPISLQVRIPENYKANKPVPLFVWISGGKGSSSFGGALSLVNKEDFVLVGLPYPKAYARPQDSRPWEASKMWEIQAKMLGRLVEMIPNIDPRLRAVGGFSNGAHTIGHCLGEKIESFCDYFNVFVIIEGGWSDRYDYPPMEGKYLYLTWGTAPGAMGNDFGKMLTDKAKTAHMEVESHSMEGVGHANPATEQAKVKTWMNEIVIPKRLAVSPSPLN